MTELVNHHPVEPPKRGALVVVGTGIQWGGQTTMASERAIRDADAVLFAVADAWAARWVRSLNARATPLPYPRDGRSRRDIYREMTSLILEALDRSERVCAVFYGSPTFLARSAHEALHAARAAGFSAVMLPGVTALECLAADLGIDFGELGYQVHEAGAFVSRPRHIDTSAHLILCQVAMIGQHAAFDGDADRVQRGLARLSECLLAAYPASHRGVIYQAARHPAEPPVLVHIGLAELAAASVGEVATLYIPPLGFDLRLTSEGRRAAEPSSDSFYP